MCDEWMQGLELTLTPDQFRALPRHAAFRYDYLSGRGIISPRPRYYHALLDVHVAPTTDSRVDATPVADADWETLEPLFATAFARTAPFAGLDDATRRRAAAQCLTRTRDGGDGPFVPAASFVARHDGELVGALLTTLLPAGDPCDWDSYQWPHEPPADAFARCLGRPHLTWVFVAPDAARHGIATALLATAAEALRGAGYDELVSTFLLGNDASALWHWRCGFRLLTHPGSPRRPATDG